MVINDILNGRWDSVLKTISTLRIPMNKLIDLHEQVLCCLSRLTATLVPYTSPFHSPSVDCTLQIVLELIELHETEVARFFFF